MNPPRFETRDRPSGGTELYRCSDCGRMLTASEAVRWDLRYFCPVHATARGLSA
jgi:hypothetical protein